MINQNVEVNNWSLKEKLSYKNIKFVDILNPHKADKEELLELVDAALYLVNDKSNIFTDSKNPKKNSTQHVKNEEPGGAKRFNFDLFTNDFDKDESSEESSDE